MYSRHRPPRTLNRKGGGRLTGIKGPHMVVKNVKYRCKRAQKGEGAHRHTEVNFMHGGARQLIPCSPTFEMIAPLSHVIH